MKLCDYDSTKNSKFIAYSLIFIGCIVFIQWPKQLVLGNVFPHQMLTVIVCIFRWQCPAHPPTGRWVSDGQAQVRLWELVAMPTELSADPPPAHALRCHGSAVWDGALTGARCGAHIGPCCRWSGATSRLSGGGFTGVIHVQWSCCFNLGGQKYRLEWPMKI